MFAQCSGLFDQYLEGFPWPPSLFVFRLNSSQINPHIGVDTGLFDV